MSHYQDILERRKKKKEEEKEATSPSSNGSKSYYNEIQWKRTAQKYGFDTLHDDLLQSNEILNSATSGWHTQDEMRGYRDQIAPTTKKLGRYNKYASEYGVVDNLDEINSLYENYKSALKYVDQLAEEYAGYKDADAYSAYTKKMQMKDQFSGLSYDQVQEKLKEYEEGSEEHKYLSTYTDYSDLTDFDKALDGPKSSGASRVIGSNADKEAPVEKANSQLIQSQLDKFKSPTMQKADLPKVANGSAIAFVPDEEYLKNAEAQARNKEYEAYLDKLEVKKNQYELDHTFDRYSHYLEAEDFAENSQYQGSQYNGLWDRIANAGADVYEYINEIRKYKNELGEEGWKKYGASMLNTNAFAGLKPMIEGLENMTDEEMGVFFYIANNKDLGLEKAYEYAKDMEVTLSKRGADATATKDKEWLESGNAVERKLKQGLMSALTVPVNVVGRLEGAVDDASNLLTGNEVNPYSDSHSKMNWSENVRETTGENIAEYTEMNDWIGTDVPIIGNAWNWLYDSSMSIGESALGVATFGTAQAPLAGLGSFSSRAKELKEAGATDAQIAHGAIASGVFEYLGEKIGIDNLFKIKDSDSLKSLLKSVRSQMFAEGGEEAFTEIMNIAGDWANRGMFSDISQKYQEYIEKGFSASEALSKTALDFGTQIASATLSGMLSGGVMGGATSTNQYYGLSNTGKQIQSNNRAEDLMGIKDIMPEDSHASELFNEYEAKGYTADNISKARLGNLYQTARQEALDTINSKEATDDQKTDAVSRLMKLNEINTVKQSKVTSTGKEANIEGIKVQDDGVTLVTSAGDVSESDMTLSSKDSDRLYYAKRMGEEKGNVFLSQYDGKSNIEEFAHSFEMAYTYGEALMDDTMVLENKGVMTEAQALEAYKAGVKNRNSAEQIQLQKAVDEINQKYASNTFVKGTVDDSIIDYNGTSTDGSKVRWKNLSKRQRNAVTFVKAFAEATGMNVKFIQSEVVNGKRVGKNGSYNRETNTVEIDVYAGIINASSIKDSIIPTLSHEMTHWMKNKSPQMFANMSEHVLETLTLNGKMTRNDLISKEMDRIKKNHPEMKVTEDMAIDELVARTCEDMLANSNEARKMLNRMSVKEQNSFVAKVKETFQNLMQWVNDLLKQYKSGSDEAKVLREYRDRLKELSKMWDKALTEAVKTNQSMQEMSSDEQATINRTLNEIGLEYDSDTETVYSMRSLEEAFDYNKSAEEYLRAREEYVNALVKATGRTKAEANRYLDSLFLVHDMIANDTARLDYESAIGRSAWVSNVEYGGSIDFSTLCAKRRLFTGTMDAIHDALPDAVLNENDFLAIRNMLLEKELESPCSMCYVEGSRAKADMYIKQWLDEYLATDPEWKPRMRDFASATRLNHTRINHPEAYKSYQEAMNKLSQRKPKEASVRTDYKGEILVAFEDGTSVKIKNENGGIRFNSFSDFEIIHALDCMQVITDMARVGLAGQGYTKVKEFAECFGKTGLKINLSLVAKGVDKNGKLIFDEVNGMKYADAMELRNKYSSNVGTVIVAFTNEQIKSALADPTIDYVLPFHRSQWKKAQYALMGLPVGTKDYTNVQNDRIKNPSTGRAVKLEKIKAVTKYTNAITGESYEIKGNIMPNMYWDYSKSGRENAQEYLNYINANKMTPKFQFLLQKEGNNWVLPDGAVGDGYFKLLIDFKMYDNNGVGSPQMPVVPEFNMPFIQQMLEDYKGGHQSFPVAHDVVDEFVNGYKKKHPQEQYSERYSDYDEPITTADVETLRNIGRKSVNEFSSDDLQKAQKWAHKFYKELGVKSPFFRSWFGDWRSEDKTPLSPITMDTNAIFKAGSAINADTGEKLSWNGDMVKESRLNASKDNKEDVEIISANIAKVVENGILLDTTVSTKTSKRKMDGTSWMHSFYGIARIDNRDILFKLYAENAFSEKQESSFTRAYSLKHIKKIAEIDDGVLILADGLTESHSTISINSVADLHGFVKQYDSDFKPKPVNPVLLNDDGTPKVVYHGTNSEFSKFTSKDGTYWFSESQDYAEAMSEERNGDRIIQAYVRMNNPYVTSLPPNKFSDPVAEKPIIRYAKENGYDGIIIKNDTDNEFMEDTFYVVFEPTQIKSATDNIGTFDGDNEDILFSDRDSDGTQLSEGQQEFFKDSKIRDKNGNLMVVYHGTKQGEFYTFSWYETQRADGGFYGRGHYFTSSKNMAEMYGDRIVKAYLNITNPFVWDEETLTYNGVKPSSVIARNVISRINMSRLFPKLFADNTMTGALYDKETGTYVEKNIKWSDLEKEINILKDKLILREFADGTFKWFTEGKFFEESVGDSFDSVESAERGKFESATMALKEKYDGIFNDMSFDDQTTYTQYNGTEITETLKSMGYDGAMQTRGGDEIVAFYSNQIKDVNNTNPTDDPDIRYSDREDISVYDLLGENENLQKQNEKLAEDVARLKERLKLERQITNGNTFNARQLTAVAKHLKNVAKSDYSEKALIEDLKEVYTYIVETPQLDWADLMVKCYEVSENVLKDSKGYKVTNDFYKSVLGDIRKARISLNEEQIQEAKNAYGDQYRNAFMGRVMLTKDGTKLDQKWQEWSTMYPDIFDANIAPAEQITALSDIYNALREGAEMYQTYNDEESIRSFAVEIYNQYWNVSTIQTTADKYDKQIKRLNYEHRNAMSELREDYKKRVQDQKLADSIHYGKIIRDIRRRKDAEVKQAKKLGKQRMDAYKERAEKNAKIQSIKTKTRKLEELLIKNSKEKHISEDLKPMVRSLIKAIDYETSVREIRQFDKMGYSLSPTEKEVKAINDSMKNVTEAKNDQKLLYALYEVQKKLDSAEFFGLGLEGKIEELIEDLNRLNNEGNYPLMVLNAMSLDQLDTINKLVGAVSKVVSNANKLHTTRRNMTADGLGGKITGFLDQLGVGSIYAGTLGKYMKMFKWSNTVPYYAFKRLGEGGQELFKLLQDGWSKLAFNINEIMEFADATYTEKDAKEWGSEIKDITVAGKTYQMTVPQIMSLYCLYQREQGRKHILGHGIKIGKIEVGKKVLNQAKDITVSAEDVTNIISLLDDKQLEVAKQIQKFMNDVCSEWGNYVSMERFGYKAFEEENYFPIKVDPNNLKQDKIKDNKNVSLYALLNMGFTKSLNEEAKNAVMIEDIFDVFANHASEMAKYNALGLAVLDLNRVMNYSAEREGEPYSIRTAMENAYGEDAYHYFSKFMADLNGTQNTSRDVIGKTMMSRAKIGSIGWNIKTVLLQPTAYLKASAIIAKKHLLNAVVSDPRLIKRGVERAKKYCGIALWKSLGFYDTNVSRGVVDQIKRKKTWTDTIAEKSTKWMGKADEYTFGLLWNACELEIKSSRPDLKNDEFYQAVAERLEEVVYATQVVDSTITRSEMMRSGDGMDKMLTAFGSEPTLAYNMLLDCVMETSMLKRSGASEEAVKNNKRKVARVLDAYIATNLVTAILEAFVSAFREEDELEEDEIIKMILKNFASNMSVIGKIPFLKDIVSLFSGYSASRLDMQGFQSAVYAYNSFRKNLKGEGNVATTIKHSMKAYSSLMGVPVFNPYRDATALFDKLGIITYEELEDLMNEIID